VPRSGSHRHGQQGGDPLKDRRTRLTAGGGFAVAHQAATRFPYSIVHPTTRHSPPSRTSDSVSIAPALFA
jgi:hypothetical protein